MISGRLSRYFKAISLIKIFSLLNESTLLASYFKGRRQIDAIWIFSILYPWIVSFTTFNFGVGYYRTLIINFDSELFLRIRVILMRLILIRQLTLA